MGEWYRLKEDWNNPAYDRRYKRSIRAIKMLPKGTEIYVITDKRDADECENLRKERHSIKFCHYKNVLLPGDVFDLCETVTKSWSLDEFVEDVGSFRLRRIIKGLVTRGVVSLDQLIDVAIAEDVVDADKYRRQGDAELQVEDQGRPS